MKQTFNTFCPCFPGFYNSFLYHEDMDFQAVYDKLDHFSDENDIPFDLLEKVFNQGNFELETDFAGYMNTAAEYFCEVTAEKLNDIFYFNPVLDVDDPGFVIEFEKVVSPKFYNYETDSVNCRITFNPDLLFAYCREYETAFAEYLEDRYKSKSGFISFYDYDVETWLNVENWTGHHPGAILEFILLNEDKDAEFNLSYRVIENIYYSSYCELPQKFCDLFECSAGKEIVSRFNAGEFDVKTAAELFLQVELD